VVKRTFNYFCVIQIIIPSCNKLLPITKEKTRFPWEKEYLRIRNSVVLAVMRWAGHVARMGEERGAYRVLVGKPEGETTGET